MDNAPSATDTDTDLKRSVTGRLLFFYVLGDVLGSGIYVLIASVAGAVGGAFWIAFAVGVTVAICTGLAYAEMVTKYPRAAGASLFVHQAFGNKKLTFLVTICMLSMSFAAAGSLASGFSSYFAELWTLPPALLVSIVFLALLAIVNFIGITESVVANMIMTFVEVAGLVVILLIGIVYVAQGKADFGTLREFSADGSPALAILAGVALAFFAMTGFENAANIAEEAVEPAKNFPRALVSGMVVAGIIYVLVAITAALTVDLKTLSGSDAALMEVVRTDVLPIPLGVMLIVFAVIAMVAITNTTLVALVTESRILYGMSREGVVPGLFGRLHSSRRSPWVALLFSLGVLTLLLIAGQILLRATGEDVVETLATVTVVFTLVIYNLVIFSALKMRGKDEHDEVYHAPKALLAVGFVANIAILGYVIYDDWTSLLWCAGLLAVGLVLMVAQMLFGSRAQTKEP